MTLALTLIFAINFHRRLSDRSVARLFARCAR